MKRERKKKQPVQQEDWEAKQHAREIDSNTYNVTAVQEHSNLIHYTGLGPSNSFERTVFSDWLNYLPLWLVLKSKFPTNLMLSLSFQQSWFQISI